jgi:hypothetical protein
MAQVGPWANRGRIISPVRLALAEGSCFEGMGTVESRLGVSEVFLGGSKNCDYRQSSCGGVCVRSLVFQMAKLWRHSMQR